MASRKKIDLKTLLERAGLEKVSFNVAFAQASLDMKNADREAAWELYVEMLTRVVTQRLPFKHGDEERALESVYSLFPTTRDILKRKGRSCIQFTKIAVPVLNQIVRPFTAKWHRQRIEGALKKRSVSVQFRKELELLQEDLGRYTRLLAEIAGVEDLTKLESGQ